MMLFGDLWVLQLYFYSGCALLILGINSKRVTLLWGSGFTFQKFWFVQRLGCLIRMHTSMMFHTMRISGDILITATFSCILEFVTSTIFVTGYDVMPAYETIAPKRSYHTQKGANGFQFCCSMFIRATLYLPVVVLLH